MKLRFDICDPFYYISAFLFLFVPFKLGIIAISDGWGGYNHKYPYFYEFLLYTCIFIFFVYVSYGLFRKSKQLFIPTPLFLKNKKDTDFYFSFSRTLISCVVIIFLFLLYLRLVNLSLAELLDNRLIEFKYAKGSQVSFAIFSFYTVLLQFTFFFNIYYLYQGKKNYLSVLCIGLTYLFITVFSGSRHMFLDMAMLIVLARMLVLRSIPWMRLCIVMSILLVFFGYYDNLRAARLGDADFLTVLLREVDIGDLLMRVLDRRTDSYFPNGPIYLQNQEIFGLRYGYEIVKIFLMLIPKSILPERETFFSQEWNDSLQLQTEGGTSFTPIVEAMVNFGIVGIPFYGIMGGYLLALASRWYKQSWLQNDPVGVFFASRILIFIPNMGIIAGGYGSPGMLAFLLNVCFFFLLLTIVKYKYRWT